MERQVRFSEEVIEKIGHYVYRLIDPRNGDTFYVGRGQGSRVFFHAAGEQKPSGSEDSGSLKLDKIRDIKNSDFEVQHIIHRHGMSESAALEVEAALIDAYPGLTNIQPGYDNGRGQMHAKEIIRSYGAPEAKFKHDLILINVRKSIEQQGLYDAVRCSWKVSLRRAKLAKYALAVTAGLIRGAFEIKNWLPDDGMNFASIDREGYGPRKGRFGFEGDEASEEIKELYVYKRVPDEYRPKGAANPIRYVGCEL
jgi:hypothetical protein